MVSATDPDATTAADADDSIGADGPAGGTSAIDGPATSVAPPAAQRRLTLFLVIAFAVLVLDLISKSIVVAELGDRKPIRLLGGALYLLETRNSGAAFSFATGATAILTLVALVVIVVIARAARRLRSIGWAVALGLILGGALGNLVDRVFRAPGLGRGHVVDWISLFSDDGHIWPVFNLADSGVVCGAITAAIVALVGIEFDGSRRRPTTSSS